MRQFDPSTDSLALRLQDQPSAVPLAEVPPNVSTVWPAAGTTPDEPEPTPEPRPEPTPEPTPEPEPPAAPVDEQPGPQPDGAPAGPGDAGVTDAGS